MSWILIIACLLLSLIVSWRFKQKVSQYSEIGLSNGKTGKEIAEKMLKDNGIYDVQVISVEGQLTDHYNPIDKTVNLSPEVYSGRSVLSAAIAAHECGHAVQHSVSYQWLMLRSRVAPTVSIVSQWIQWVLLAGVLLYTRFPNLLLIAIVLFALTVFFTFITLPVEFDASRRAMAWLNSSNMIKSEEEAGARDALKWAAMTYVVAALSALATLIYYVTIFLGRRN